MSHVWTAVRLLNVLHDILASKPEKHTLNKITVRCVTVTELEYHV